MKISNCNKLFVGVLVLILSVGFVGCKDNGTGSNNDIENKFTYNGEDYELGWGIIFDYGEFTEGFRNYDFSLLEVEEDTASENVNSEHGLYFWFESVGPGSFDEGTYTYSDTNIDEHHLYEGGLIFFGETEDDYEFYDVTGGEVEISIDGDTYTLDMDLVLDNGESLTGNFTYEFEIIDETDGSAKIVNDSKPSFFNK